MTACDRLPAGLVFVSASVRTHLRAGRLCWSIAKIGPHRHRGYTMTVRALPGADGRLTNIVTISGTASLPRRATATVRVTTAARRSDRRHRLSRSRRSGRRDRVSRAGWRPGIRMLLTVLLVGAGVTMSRGSNVLAAAGRFLLGPGQGKRHGRLPTRIVAPRRDTAARCWRRSSWARKPGRGRAKDAASGGWAPPQAGAPSRRYCSCWARRCVTVVCGCGCCCDPP